MVQAFYDRHSRTLLAACLLALTICALTEDRIVSNNDIDTWLSSGNASFDDYQNFRDAFGADETILIAFEQPFPEPELMAALARRIDRLGGVTSCLTRHQVLDAMLSNGVNRRTAEDRLVHLLTAPEGDMETLLVVLSKDGIRKRAESVAHVRGQLKYCGLQNAVLAGAPVVATQLDLLGSRDSSKHLFLITLLICLVLLYGSIGCWKTSAALMVANVFCIKLTLSALWVTGREMNFIMSSLPVMVMVFTTAAAIHFIGHYRQNYARNDRIGAAMRGVIWPSMFASVTTIIGLLSLSVSDVRPIADFGTVAAYGTGFAFLVGVFVTPAILVVTRYHPTARRRISGCLERWAMLIVNRPARFLVPVLAATLVCAVGLTSLRSLIDPLEFLPASDPVLRDTLVVRDKLTSPTSIELMVDFGSDDSSFVERLRQVRQLEEICFSNSNVCHALSLADFFPREISERTFSARRLMTSASANPTAATLIADGSRLWRISLRLHDDTPASLRHTIDELEVACSGAPVTFTGMGALLEEAQQDIFRGFWRSFACAFILISIVMVLALKSPLSGLAAMIPNLTPIMLVFGILGWCDYPVDIGIMMSASIALGLAVDGTFHFLFRFRSGVRAWQCRYRAVRLALLETSLPIIASSVISGISLLALSISPFRPTMRFGILMFCLLMMALVGDLLLLPAFLALRVRHRRIDPPHRRSQAGDLAA